MVMTRNNQYMWEKMDKEPIELSSLGQHFELFNRTEGNSTKTLRWYEQSLKQFQQFLKKTGKLTNLANLGESEVREFILYLQDRRKWQDNPCVRNNHGKLSVMTIQNYIRALRAFFNWLYKEGYIEEHRLAKLKPPKAPKKVTEILTHEEINKILSCLDLNLTSGARGYAIILLFLDSGLRLSELTNAKIDNLNIEEGYLKVMGKGNKERIVPFGTSTQKALLRYILHFRPLPYNPTIKNVFLTLDGRTMSYDCVKTISQRLAKKSGVNRLHPHLCRHTFATNYLINGGDVFTLLHILGHTTLEMVRSYVNLASAHVAIQH
ncbi:MAG: tyrosine-type recombinase/integrase, partial [Promethearchaeota archaeon]